MVGVLLLAAPVLARANIGDTLPELRARYGSAKDMGGQMLFEVRLVGGHLVPATGSTNAADHFSITVYFDGVHSGMEIFTRNTSDPSKAEMTQADIDAILAATNDGQSWDSIQVPSGRPTWLRADKKLLARFDPNKTESADNASVLIIMVNDQRK